MTEIPIRVTVSAPELEAIAQGFAVLAAGLAEMFRAFEERMAAQPPQAQGLPAYAPPQAQGAQGERPAQGPQAYAPQPAQGHAAPYAQQQPQQQPQGLPAAQPPQGPQAYAPQPAQGHAAPYAQQQPQGLPAAQPQQAQQAYAPQPQAQGLPAAPARYTKDRLAAAGIQVMDMGKRGRVAEILAGLGAQSLPELDEGLYGAFADALAKEGADI